MPFANFKLPEAALNKAQKEELVHRTTAMLVDYFGAAARPHTMVLIEEVPDGAMRGPTRCLSCRTAIAPKTKDPALRCKGRVVRRCNGLTQVNDAMWWPG